MSHDPQGRDNPTTTPDPERPGHTCAHCGRTSHNLDDLAHRYCGWCRHYCDDVSGR